MADISVIIPARDEAAALPALLAEILSALNSHDGALQIIVVNDGSQDHTAEVLAGCQQHYPMLTVIAHSQAMGQSAALLSAARYAQHAVLVMLDGDGQNDPADIPRLLAALQPHIDLVGGVRVQRHDSLSRRLASRLANAIRDGLLHDECPDSGCGMQVIRREAFLELPRFHGMHRFLAALCRQQGLNTCYLAVNHRSRQSGYSKYSLFGRARVGLVDLLGVWWLSQRGLPADPAQRQRLQ